MGLSDQHAAYSDCFDKLDLALDDAKGIRILFENYSAAKLFQLRACKARVLDRKQSIRIYKPDDPKWGTSPYDILVIRNPKEADEKDGTWWVYLEPQGQETIIVESLSDEDETTATD